VGGAAGVVGAADQGAVSEADVALGDQPGDGELGQTILGLSSPSLTGLDRFEGDAVRS
jgi:hypothetical protein